MYYLTALNERGGYKKPTGDDRLSDLIVVDAVVGPQRFVDFHDMRFGWQTVTRDFFEQITVEPKTQAAAGMRFMTYAASEQARKQFCDVEGEGRS